MSQVPELLVSNTFSIKLAQIECMKFRDIVKTIEADGWTLLPRTGSSHRQFAHPRKPGRVTIAGEPGDDVNKGTLNNILKQAGLKKGGKE